ncbi:MAG: AEC family transporter [Verrucomicrobiota bacterium]|nr:AEC family transporter [Verrucomicrobiota bacterium]
MDGLINILYSIFPPFSLLIIGAVTRKIGWFKAEADASLSMVTIRLLYPCFIFQNILDSEDFALDFSSLLTPVFGFCTILIGFMLASILSKIFKMRRDEAASFRFCSGIFNYGFLAIPIAQSLFGSEIVVRIILFNLGVEVAIWTVGISILTTTEFPFKNLLNPPSLAVLLALLVHFFGGVELIPSFTWVVIQDIGQCSIPIGLILIGGSFYDLMRNFKFSKGYKIEIASIVARNLLFPSVIISYLLFFPMPNGMEWMKMVLITQAAMPAGIFAIVIVGNYKADLETAMRTILVTMITAPITVPVWLVLGSKLLFD